MTGPPDPTPEHYFTPRPQVSSRPGEITVAARGLTLCLQTDRGVFSPSGLDRGTRLLAEKMQLRPGTELLDWGAGYGPLGLIAASLCPTCRVTLVELNERAAQLAEANAHSLGLDNVEVITGPAPEALGARQFDAIISNPPLRVGKPAVAAVIEYAARHLQPGGELWLVIPTNKGAKTYFQQMAKLFPHAETKAISGGYRILWAAREASTTI
jgi:16S rRNA (guanine1207-N2)-methyltransferase